MAASPAIRILLAALVALWSPAWCCCRIVEAAECSPAPTGHHDDDHTVDKHHDDHTPCSGHEDEQSSPCNDDDDCGCQNHDRQVDLVKPVKVPTLEPSGTIGWPVVAFSASVSDVVVWSASDGPVRQTASASVGILRAHGSLHARRCLLLI